jgi:hypothetical protein
MIAQRVYGLALGYEDLNDHDRSREDPLWCVLAGSEEGETGFSWKEHAEPNGTVGGGRQGGPLQESWL